RLIPRAALSPTAPHGTTGAVAVDRDRVAEGAPVVEITAGGAKGQRTWLFFQPISAVAAREPSAAPT
ncbi:MAG: hypothetical protein ABW185_21065, partial [Sedimenticola sp.]